MLQDPTVDGSQENGFCQNMRRVLSPIPEHSEVDRSDVTVEFVPEDAEMPVPFNGSKIDPDVFKEGEKNVEKSIGCETQISNPLVHGNSENENVAGGRNMSDMPSEVDFVSENITPHIPPNYECVYDPVSIENT